MLDLPKSHIRIVHDLEQGVATLIKELSSNRVISFIRDEFKVEDAKAVIAESYISESQVKYIILAAKNFSNISQNTLLKVLEEPPKNIEIILLSQSKSSLLPTIRSRLPLKYIKIAKNCVKIDLNFSKLDFNKVFDFIKNHQNIKKSEAKELIEAIFIKAVDDGVVMSEDMLESFNIAYRSIDLNARVQSVFTMLLLGFANAS